MVKQTDGLSADGDTNFDRKRRMMMMTAAAPFIINWTSFPAPITAWYGSVGSGSSGGSGGGAGNCGGDSGFSGNRMVVLATPIWLHYAFFFTTAIAAFHGTILVVGVLYVTCVTGWTEWIDSF